MGRERRKETECRRSWKEEIGFILSGSKIGVRWMGKN